MRSLRGELTRAHVLGGLATSLALVAVLLGSERTVARRALQRQVDEAATVAARVLAQAGTGRFAGIVVTSDSAAPPALSPAVARTLAALPGFLLVADGPAVLFESEAVRRLAERDRATLIAAATTLLTPGRPAAEVRLTTQTVFVRLRGEEEALPSDAAEAPLRVIAGRSQEPLALTRLDGFGPLLVAVGLLTLISGAVAWGVIGASLQPLERLSGSLEAIQHGRSLHRRVREEEGVEEVDRLAETINAMIARIEASFAALRRFTADASHELKSPLAVLRANLERTMATAQVPPEQLAPLEDALAETARMADLVESLLTLARADEGRYDLHREPVPLAPLVLELFETAGILGEEAGVTVQLTGVEPLMVSGEAMRLRQLGLNLVTNAVKYTPAGGRVSLGLSRRGEEAALVVDDTGVGIAAPDLPFIFERFWRADRSRARGGERGGFGLGLAISEWIAHAHGGTITVASRPGRGTTFTVLLPLDTGGTEASGARS